MIGQSAAHKSKVRRDCLERQLSAARDNASS